MDESNFLEETRNCETGSPNSRRRSKIFSLRIRSFTTSRFISRCRWSDKWLLVHVRKLHIPPSRWIQSQNFTRRDKNHSLFHWSTLTSPEQQVMQEKPHRWLLEYRWIKMFVIFLDRFHSVYSIKWETSRWIYVVQRETDKTASDIQARSFMARTLDEAGKKCWAEGEAKMV